MLRVVPLSTFKLEDTTPALCLGSGTAADEFVVVNGMCQLDWVMGCPDIGSNIILGISGIMSVLLDEIKRPSRCAP